MYYSIIALMPSVITRYHVASIPDACLNMLAAIVTTHRKSSWGDFE